jgi:SAM-dependent methyltransferase
MLTKNFYQLKKIKYILKGIASYFPDCISKYLPRHQLQFSGDGVREYPGRIAVARICYSIWLRFLVSFYECGLYPKIDTVVEIGPGDSFGVGLAALLSGANNYFALDVVKTAYRYPNHEIFRELVFLFRHREGILNDEEEPKMLPRLNSYEFPEYIFSDDKLNQLLNKERLEAVRNALLCLERETLQGADNVGPISMHYFVPWDRDVPIKNNSVDVVIATAVMEHVEDIEMVYETAARWLKKGGIFANCIDFKSHGTAGLWNGHWTYSDFVWKLVRGRSRFFINRQPHSVHKREMAKFFDIISDITYRKPNLLRKSDLSCHFKMLDDDDLTICSAYIIGKKK